MPIATGIRSISYEDDMFRFQRVAARRIGIQTQIPLPEGKSPGGLWFVPTLGLALLMVGSALQ